MITDWMFYLVAIPAVMANGMAKGGFSGVGALSLPLMQLGGEGIALVHQEQHGFFHGQASASCSRCCKLR